MQLSAWTLGPPLRCTRSDCPGDGDNRGLVNRVRRTAPDRMLPAHLAVVHRAQLRGAKLSKCVVRPHNVTRRHVGPRLPPLPPAIAGGSSSARGGADGGRVRGVAAADGCDAAATWSVRRLRCAR